MNEKIPPMKEIVPPNTLDPVWDNFSAALPAKFEICC